MQSAAEQKSWSEGFDCAISQAISVIDAMRGPDVSNMASPILLRIRAELIALRESEQIPAAAA